MVLKEISFINHCIATNRVRIRSALPPSYLVSGDIIENIDIDTYKYICFLFLFKLRLRCSSLK